MEDIIALVLYCIVSLMIFLVFIVLGIMVPNFIRYIIKKIKKRATTGGINFNEFDDIDKIKQQEEKEREQMKNELEVLNRVATRTFFETGGSVLSFLHAKRDVEQAREDIKNFELLDSVEVEGKKIYEGVSIKAIKENCKNFDAELFKKWSREIFLCVKSGTEEDLKVVKNFITEGMYDKLLYQMQQFEKDGLDYVTEDLLIEKIKIADYGRWDSKEEIKVFIKAKMREYIVQKSTNRVLRGSRRKAVTKKFIMTFLKKDIQEQEGFITNCPNCGAGTTQTEFGKCTYCGTLIFPIRYNWTLIKFETF